MVCGHTMAGMMGGMIDHEFSRNYETYYPSILANEWNHYNYYCLTLVTNHASFNSNQNCKSIIFWDVQIWYWDDDDNVVLSY